MQPCKKNLKFSKLFTGVGYPSIHPTCLSFPSLPETPRFASPSEKKENRHKSRRKQMGWKKPLGLNEVRKRATTDVLHC